MATVTDSFTYSNGSLVTVSGGLWKNVIVSQDVSSGTVVNHTNGDGVCSWAANSFTNDQDSQVVAAVLPSGSDGGPTVRHQSGSVSFYLADFSLDVGKWNLAYYRCDSGAFTQLGTTVTAIAVAVAGDTLKLAVAGSTLTASVNGAAQATRTDATYASGVPGMHLSGSVSTPAWDNWQSTAAVTGTTENMGWLQRTAVHEELYEDIVNH